MYGFEDENVNVASSDLQFEQVEDITVRRWRVEVVLMRTGRRFGMMWRTWLRSVKG
jgi:hypothetical protein